MRREFISCFGRMTGTKSAILREAYRRLTGDASAAETSQQQDVDSRIQELLDSEDPDIIWDLRVNNNGRPELYTEYLEACKLYIDGKLDTAVDERRHDNVTEDGDGNTLSVSHLAVAISAPDLHREVCKELPEGVAIPSVQWLRLQFWPRNRSHASSKYYTGRLKLKFMIQARQFKQTHIDYHYASALFRYEKEFAIKYRENVQFVAMDDKHTCKVGEPGFPVAAVERGKQVIVSKNQSLQVADHDFTKFSVTPSVTMIINVPENVDGSFYDGQIHVGVKENCFQPSSPMRHMAELVNILEKDPSPKPILCLYTDGGPDHRLTYLSVQIALISLFIRLNKDMVVVRTPPHNSWKNPPERVMSILNQGLQCMGLMRQPCTEEVEELLKSAKSMKDIRVLAESDPEITSAVLSSLKPTKELMCEIFQRLNLKGKFFQTFDAASEPEILELFAEMKSVDDSLKMTDTTKEKAEKKVDFQNFLKSHCVQRQYLFSVKKCDDVKCSVCMPPKLPIEIFSTLHHLPDPIPNGEHYKPFADVYGTKTKEIHLPSLKEKEGKGHKMPFNPSAQTAKNTDIFLKCSDCSKPRVLHSKRKLKQEERLFVEGLLEVYSYSCGANVQNISLDDEEQRAVLEKVFVRANLVCNSPIEVPYYSAGYENCCYHCGNDNNLIISNGKHPICTGCKDKKKAPKKKKGPKPTKNNK